MVDPVVGAVKLGDFGLVRALEPQQSGRANGGATASGSAAPDAPQGLQRSNSFPRVGANGGVGASGRTFVTANVATGGSGGAPMELPPRWQPQPGGGVSRLTRRLTPLIFGPPAPASTLGACDAWLPPGSSQLQPHPSPPRRLRRQMTPNTGSLVTMAPEVWGSQEYGFAADIYSLVR